MIKQNGPLLSSALAGIGVGVTAYFTAKATFKAAELIQTSETLEPDVPMSNREKVKLVWRCYIPPAVAGIGTVLLIGNGHRLATNKALAAQAALAVTDRAYTEYRDKVADELGEHKDQRIRDEIAQDRVRENPPPSELIAEAPEVLCHEAFTGRYFICSKEKLHRAENRIVAKTLKHEYATLDDFYHQIGLKITSTSGENGWVANRTMELLFSSVLTDDGRPALSFEYNYVKPLIDI